jgi:hypothetical protein
VCEAAVVFSKTVDPRKKEGRKKIHKTLPCVRLQDSFKDRKPTEKGRKEGNVLK